MSGIEKAIVGAQIHDGHKLHRDHALVVHKNGRLGVVPVAHLPPDCPQEPIDGGLITPGFVDLQVNGGGGVMFNDDQSIDALRSIALANASIGTGALLPTLITDTADRTRTAIQAVEQAIAAKVKGIIGIHLEGPHLSVARKGAHDPQLIRPMSGEDLEVALDAAERLPHVMMTVAPENTTLAQIKRLSDAGVIVSLGHTNADFETCLAAFDAGARCVTHLFNAMSQFGSREPGLVGAALHRDDVYAGLIADGIHVHPATIEIALSARTNNDRIFLVTDAMASAGSDIESFKLNGRRIQRKDKHLTLEDGTLAGADLEMVQALSVMVSQAGDDLTKAVARATSVPASILDNPGGIGRLEHVSDTVLHISNNLSEVKSLSLNAATAPASLTSAGSG